MIIVNESAKCCGLQRWANNGYHNWPQGSHNSMPSVSLRVSQLDNESYIATALITDFLVVEVQTDYGLIDTSKKVVPLEIHSVEGKAGA
jgi:hypothetical protein